MDHEPLQAPASTPFVVTSSNMDEAPRPVVGLAIDIDGPRSALRHSHQRAQLIYTAKGTLTVTTDAGIWVVPPDRAVWVPGGMVHEVENRAPAAMRMLYFDEQALKGRIPTGVSVVSVSPLLAQLITHVVESIPPDYDEQGPDGRLIAVLLDQLRQLPVEPLSLPMPKDPRLKTIHSLITENPGDERKLDDWAGVIGASTRTLARLFVKDTGLTFGQWRQRVRLLAALDRLASGDSVTTVALDLGYDSPSAFIAMFRKTLGVTPGRYFTATSPALR